MAIVLLVALLAAFGIAALVNSHPWAPNQTAPRLSVAPGLEVALGDAVAVSHGRQLAVAPAAPAGGGKARLVAQRADGGGAGAPQLGIGPARAVATPRPAAGPEDAPAPHAPESSPAPESATAPEAVPVAAPAPPRAAESAPAPPGPIPGSEGSPQGPIAGGVGMEGALTEVQVCEGDEYTLSFSQSDTEAGPEAVPAPPGSAAAHEVTVYFGTSDEGRGFYLASLDGQPIDIGETFTAVDSGSSCALIDPKHFVVEEEVEGSFEIRFEGLSLDEALESALP